MAAAKTKAKTKPAAIKSNGAAKWQGVELPEGYRAIKSMRGERWDFENEPLLEGVVEALRMVETGTGKQKRQARVISVRSHDGRLLDVWESTALTDFFDEVEKSGENVPVAIAFKGYLDVGRPQAMKNFIAGIQAPESKTRPRAGK